MKNISGILIAVLLFAACSKNEKKILVMSRGPATVNKENHSIDVTGSANDHEEQTLEYNTADKISLKIRSQAGEALIDIPENGYYILNAKTDTIVGGYQKYSTPQEANRVMTQEELKHHIDSLQQLTENKNVSAANRNFFVLPNTAVKITANTDAFVVGPFHQMISIEKEGDKEPEVYRFYSLKEVREMIDKLVTLTK